MGLFDELREERRRAAAPTVEPTEAIARTHATPFQAGVRYGTTGVKAGLRRNLAIVQRLTGFDQAAAGNEARAAAIEQEDLAGVAPPPSFADVRAGRSGFGDYTKGLVGQQLPILGAQVASAALLRRPVGAGLRMVNPALATPARATALAAAVPVGAQIAGETYGDILQDTAPSKAAAGAALASGVAGGFLEHLPLTRLLNDIGLGRTGQGMVREALLKRVGKGVLRQAPREAATEVAQQAVSDASHRLVNEKYDLFSDQELERLLEAGVGGGTFGAIMGGVGGTVQLPGDLNEGPVAARMRQLAQERELSDFGQVRASRRERMFEDAARRKAGQLHMPGYVDPATPGLTPEQRLLMTERGEGYGDYPGNQAPPLDEPTTSRPLLYRLMNILGSDVAELNPASPRFDPGLQRELLGAMDAYSRGEATPEQQDLTRLFTAPEHRQALESFLSNPDVTLPDLEYDEETSIEDAPETLSVFEQRPPATISEGVGPRGTELLDRSVDPQFYQGPRLSQSGESDAARRAEEENANPVLRGERATHRVVNAAEHVRDQVLKRAPDAKGRDLTKLVEEQARAQAQAIGGKLPGNSKARQLYDKLRGAADTALKEREEARALLEKEQRNLKTDPIEANREVTRAAISLAERKLAAANEAVKKSYGWGTEFLSEYEVVMRDRPIPGKDQAVGGLDDPSEQYRSFFATRDLLGKVQYGTSDATHTSVAAPGEKGALFQHGKIPVRVGKDTTPRSFDLMGLAKRMFRDETFDKRDAVHVVREALAAAGGTEGITVDFEALRAMPDHVLVKLKDGGVLRVGDFVGKRVPVSGKYGQKYRDVGGADPGRAETRRANLERDAARVEDVLTRMQQVEAGTSNEDFDDVTADAEYEVYDNVAGVRPSSPQEFIRLLKRKLNQLKTRAGVFHTGAEFFDPGSQVPSIGEGIEHGLRSEPMTPRRIRGEVENPMTAPAMPERELRRGKGEPDPYREALTAATDAHARAVEAAEAFEQAARAKDRDGMIKALTEIYGEAPPAGMPMSSHKARVESIVRHLDERRELLAAYDEVERNGSERVHDRPLLDQMRSATLDEGKALAARLQHRLFRAVFEGLRSAGWMHEKAEQMLVQLDRQDQLAALLDPAARVERQGGRVARTAPTETVSRTVPYGAAGEIKAGYEKAAAARAAKAPDTSVVHAPSLAMETQEREYELAVRSYYGDLERAARLALATTVDRDDQAGPRVRVASASRPAPALQVAEPKPARTGAKLTGTSPYLAKDQRKADQATRFIGRGSPASSTARYARDFGDRANSGEYTADDVVFVSAEGARTGRVGPDEAEIRRATDAGATIVTDDAYNRQRSYNMGERQVEAILKKLGYVEEGKTGRWKPGEKGRTRASKGRARTLDADTFARTEQTAGKLTNLAQVWADKLGLKGVRLVTSVDDMLAELENVYLELKGKGQPLTEIIEAIGNLRDGVYAGLHLVGDGETVVFVDARGEPHQAVETLAHELGHAVFRQIRVDSTTAAAMRKSFERWRADRIGRHANVETTKAPYSAAARWIGIARDGGQATAYDLDFEEWFADNVSRWMTTARKPTTAVDRFFHGVAQIIRNLKALLEDFLGTDAAKVDTSVEALLSAVYDPSIRQHVEGQALGDWFKATSNIQYAAATQPASPFAHAAFTDLWRQLSKQERGVVAQALTQGTARQKLLQLLRRDGHTHEALLTENGHTIAAFRAAYHYWQRGELKAGDGPTSALRRTEQRLRDVLKLVGTDQKAQQILEAVSAGNLAAWRAQGPPDMNRVQKWANQVSDLLDKARPALRAFTSVAQRVYDTQNPALIDLVNQLAVVTGEHGRGRDYIEARDRWNGEYLTAWSKALEGLTKAEQATLMRHLRRGETPIDAKLKTAAEAFRAVDDKLFKYAETAGVRIGRAENHFPAVYDWGKIAERRQQWIDMLMDEDYKRHIDKLAYKSRLVRGAEQAPLEEGKMVPDPKYPGRLIRETVSLIPKLTDQQRLEYVTAFVDRLIENEHEDDGVLPETNVPFASSAVHSPLWFVRKAAKPEHMKVLEESQKDDLVDVLTTYTRQMVKKTEYTRRFGPDGERLEKIFHRARQLGASAQDVQLGRDLVDAVMGVYKIQEQHGLVKGALTALDKLAGTSLSADPRLWRRIQGVILTYQNIRLLAFATISSLSEVGGLLLRGDLTSAYAGLKAGAAELARSVLRMEPNERRRLAELLGAIEHGVADDALMQSYGVVSMGRKTQQINAKFFRIIGLQAWTRATRIAAFAAAQSYITRLKEKTGEQADRDLSQLNLTREDIGTGNAREKTAIKRFVDQMMLRPNATQRPLWGSNPDLAIFFHLKQFLFSAHERIVKRLGREAYAGNYAPLLSVAAYGSVALAVSTMMAALRGHPPSDDDESWLGVLDAGASRSGLYGTGQLFMNMSNNARYGGTGLEDFLGPTAVQVANGARTIFGDRTYQRTGIEALPANNVLKLLYHQVESVTE